MTLRLEGLKLHPTDIRDKLNAGGPEVSDAQQQLGLGTLTAKEQKFPMRYQYLAIEAFDRGLISEGLLSRFLAVDRLEARRIGGLLRQSVVEETDVSLIN